MNVAPPILTLSIKDISHFLIRHRRGGTLERYHPRLDSVLKEILSRANDFVSSESGAILLDDPKAKMFNIQENYLTIIAVFGEASEKLLGQRFSAEEGLLGNVYVNGWAMSCNKSDDPRGYLELLSTQTGVKCRSILCVPVFLGNAICGMITLYNRMGREGFSVEDIKLIKIFAAYISSSIQNVLDGIRAKELAQRDDLTGLYNDRYLNIRLRSEIHIAETNQRTLSLVFIDLDHFKKINDRFGHLEGSRTLHLMGILLDSEVPEKAVVARYGGDEFVVLLPESDSVHAMEVAEHLRERIAATPIQIENRPQESSVFISASFGVATLNEHVPANVEKNADRANILIKLADQAMYRAKAAGRNLVVMASPDAEE